MIDYRRYRIGKQSTNSLAHALRLIAKGQGRTLDDQRPDPKYRWLKQDILETQR
jgi:hypothetical protein